MDVSHPLSAELPLQRVNNQLLMSLVLKQGLSKSWQKTVNRVRLYLRGIPLADISTRGGLYIRPDFLIIQLRRATSPKILLTWLVENMLSKDFGILVAKLNSIARNDFLIHRRLGDWVRSPLLEQLWRYCDITKTLYGRTLSTTWKSYKSFQGTITRGNSLRFRVQSDLQELPHKIVLWLASATLLRNGGVIFTVASRYHFVDTAGFFVSHGCPKN